MQEDVGLDYEPNGHEEESPEQLNRAYKKLEDLTREGGFHLTKQELGLLHKLITAPDRFTESQFWLIADFLDGEEALDHVAAFHEAKELGMDVTFNIDFVFALCASNRGWNKTNRASSIIDAMHHLKTTSNVGMRKNDASTNPRSPLTS